MQNNLTFNDMRAALAHQLELIKQGGKPEVINSAKTVCLLAQAFVNVSKAEIDYAKASGVKLGQMIDITPEVLPASQPALQRVDVKEGVRQYKLRG
jgi:hypothetical protein